MLDIIGTRHARLLETALATHIPIQRGNRLLNFNILPPASFLLFFNNTLPENELDIDGYDNVHTQFRRDYPNAYELRWRQGSIHAVKSLTIGDAECIENSTVQSISANRKHLNLTRKIYSNSGLFLTEFREYVYLRKGTKLQKLIKNIKPETFIPESLPKNIPVHTHKVNLTDTLVFRYSALTFNAHKIHYNQKYAESEGLASPIVQGPLLLTLAMRWIYEISKGKTILKYEYKNMHLVPVNETVTMILANQKLYMTNSLGQLVHSGEVCLEPEEVSL